MLALEMTANIASSSAVGTPSTVSPRSALRSIAAMAHASPRAPLSPGSAALVGGESGRQAGSPRRWRYRSRRSELPLIHGQSAARPATAGAAARTARSPASCPSEYVGGWELDVDGTPQSHVDLDDPTHLHFEYVARMGAVIDQLRMPRQPLTAVHLGAGALTIPRYVEAHPARARASR